VRTSLRGPAGNTFTPRSAPGRHRCFKGLRARLLGPALGLALTLASPSAEAAQNVVFVSGAFRRSIPVADLVLLAETGQARGLLGDVLRLTRQDPETVAKLLNESVNLPVVLVSRLLNTRIGEVLLQRLAQIVFPLNAASVGLPALRSAVILGIADNDKGLSALSFLKAYPSQELAVSLPALMGLMSKASSISDLVRFFADSPLDGLRGQGATDGAAPAAPGDATPPAAAATRTP
jgi:hypothetical protein